MNLDTGRDHVDTSAVVGEVGECVVLVRGGHRQGSRSVCWGEVARVLAVVARRDDDRDAGVDRLFVGFDDHGGRRRTHARVDHRGQLGVFDHPFDAHQVLRGRTAAVTAEYPHRYDVGIARQPDRVSDRRARNVSAVSVAVGGDVGVRDRAEADRRAAAEDHVVGADAAVDHVHGDAFSPVADVGGTVERKLALVDAVDAPRLRCLVERGRGHDRIRFHIGDAAVPGEVFSARFGQLDRKHASFSVQALDEPTSGLLGQRSGDLASCALTSAVHRDRGVVDLHDVLPLDGTVVVQEHSVAAVAHGRGAFGTADRRKQEQGERPADAGLGLGLLVCSTHGVLALRPSSLPTPVWGCVGSARIEPVVRCVRWPAPGTHTAQGCVRFHHACTSDRTGAVSGRSSSRARASRVATRRRPSAQWARTMQKRVAGTLARPASVRA